MTESSGTSPLHSPPVPESTPPAPPRVLDRADIRKKTRKQTTQRVLVRAGIVVAASVNWILTALKQEKLITWGIITYPCLAALVAITLWLIFFR